VKKSPNTVNDGTVVRIRLLAPDGQAPTVLGDEDAAAAGVDDCQARRVGQDGELAAGVVGGAGRTDDGDLVDAGEGQVDGIGAGRGVGGLNRRA